ncbi:MAG TPA: AmmeMemoRadiSam system protein B [Candidatus Eisenbacteria bacterium]|nr:AmmeMemoRadiSam system protein B [Candidatus Eisenbacteria bacterium]
MSAAPAVPPSLEQVRSEMDIPSRDLDERGQKDAVGFASNAEQMSLAWELSTSPPAPTALGVAPAPGVLGMICPHDDYLYAARVYRQVIPLVTARTVVLIGVFHRYRRFGERGRLVFDPYRSWRTPSGSIAISGWREKLLASLPPADVVQDAAMHDSEHSVEALVYWLAHGNPEREIVPILIPEAPFDRLVELADHLADALAGANDVAVAVSADAVHYGSDFGHVGFGLGGEEAHAQAVARDLAILRGPLSGPVSDEKARALYETFVDPARPERYRVTWCGRFSIPFGVLLVSRLAGGTARAHAIAYSTSIDAPELPVRDRGLGETAPANPFHFVGYPAVALTRGGD